MPNTKITDLTALATAPDAADLIQLVDVSDTTLAATGTNKKQTVANFRSGLLTTTTQVTTSAAGAASTPALTTTGAVYTGGTGTTTVPYWYANVAGATAVTTFSGNGTFLGCNLAAGFTGNFIDLRIDGAASPFVVTAGGAVTISSTLSAGGTVSSSGNLSSGGSVIAAASGSLLWTSTARLTATTTNGARVVARNSGNTADALVQGVSFVAGRTTVADANYTILATDHLIAYTSLTAPRQATLPTASTVPNQEFVIKDEAGAAGTQTITVVGTIDGAANRTITTNYGSLRVYSNGTAYFTR